MPYLLITDRRDGSQRKAAVEIGRFVIGKKASCHLMLDRKNISREHCEIIAANGGHFVRDLDSRNGTYVNGKRIQREAPLADGSVIHLGDFTLLFRQGKADPAPGQGPSGDAAAEPAEPPAKDPAPEAPAAARRNEARYTPPELKRKIHDRLIADLDLRHMDMTDVEPEELRRRTESVIESILNKMSGEIPAWLSNQALIKEVADEALGLGPMEDLLADEEVDEIMVNGWDQIYVERHGKLELTDKRFTDNRQVAEVIRRILAPIGRRIDEVSPMVDARLADGSRVNAIIPPLSLTGPTITIRKFATNPFTVKDLISLGTLSPQIAAYLKLCVEHRRNTIISGGTGSGKTTLLNVLSAYVPRHERIITIEDAAELKLPQEHVVSLESKPPNIENKGAIPIRQLVINSLRMRPDRIIVGECRGAEALDMLQAMNTGHDGSLTTIHANSARDCLSRLETLVLMAGMELPARAIRNQIASAINMIIQIARHSDGKRRVVSINEITGMEQDTITLQETFQFDQTGIGPKGEVIGTHKPTGSIPDFIHELRKRGHKIDTRVFQETS
ncbi:MAG: ATPase, T2SS/T4P/T4SS family [Planctomycetota bacterium]